MSSPDEFDLFADPERLARLVELGVAQAQEPGVPEGENVLAGEKWAFIGCDEVMALSPEQRAETGLEEMYQWCMNGGPPNVGNSDAD